MPPVKLGYRIFLTLASLTFFIVEASALPTGLTGDAKPYYIMLLMLASILIAALYLKNRNEAPIEVVGLAYDKDKHKIELTVRNRRGQQYCMKSALRLVQTPEEYVKEKSSDGAIPMAAARMSTGDRKLYQLLCEDDSALVINPYETKTLIYDILLPKDYANISPDHNVEVSISYGEDKIKPAYLRNTPVKEKKIEVAEAEPFELEIDELSLLEELLTATRNAPSESIENHIKDRNNFSAWVGSVVKNAELANKLGEINYTSPEETRVKIMDVIGARVEALKHPFLRKVPKEKSFILKVDHGELVGEALHLEGLLEHLKNAPQDAIRFHTRSGNDFSVWVADAVGDRALAESLTGIDYSSPEAKNALEETIESRIKELRN
ncbi:MAG: DUF5752 family protein [Candidatus Altiarchaeota archaeon]|nr:DUF5752 family protein [Candidatus Altiarchaeota archaeon]